MVSGIADATTITATGQGGTGVLMYSIDGVNFQPNNVFEDITNGVYTLSVLDENGCVATDMVVVSITSLIELDFSLKFSLYPNPSDGRFIVSLDQSTGKDLNMKIFDVAGKLMQEFHFEKTNDFFEQNIDVSHFSKGSYELLLSDGENFGQKRFIILN